MLDNIIWFICFNIKIDICSNSKQFTLKICEDRGDNSDYVLKTENVLINVSGKLYTYYKVDV